MRTRLRPFMGLLTVLTMLAVSLSATTALSSTAMAAPLAGKMADKDCKDFEDFLDAIKFFESREGGGRTRDHHGLDGDNDAYPCEKLAEVTRHSTENYACLDCSDTEKRLYRRVGWLSFRDYKRVERTREAVLDVFGPISTTNSRNANTLKSALANILAALNTSTEAKCVRSRLLTVVSDQGNDGKFADASVKVFGIAQYIFEEGLADVRDPISEVLAAYMEVGKGLAEEAAKITLTTNAYGKALEIWSDCDLDG